MSIPALGTPHKQRDQKDSPTMKRERDEGTEADPQHIKIIKTEPSVSTTHLKLEPQFIHSNDGDFSKPEFISVPGAPLSTLETTHGRRSPVKALESVTLRPTGTSNVVVAKQPRIIPLPEEFADTKLQIHLNKFVDCVEKTKAILDQAESLIKEGWLEPENILPALDLPETEYLVEKDEPDWVSVISASIPKVPITSSHTKISQSTSKTVPPSQEKVVGTPSVPSINGNSGEMIESSIPSKVTESSKSGIESKNVSIKTENSLATKSVPKLVPLIIPVDLNKESIEQNSGEITAEAPTYPETPLENGEYDISLAKKRATNLIEQNNYEEACKIYLELYKYHLKNVGINHMYTREILLQIFYIFDNFEVKNCKNWLEFVKIMKNRISNTDVHPYDKIDILKCIITHVQSKWGWNIIQCSELYKIHAELIQNLEKIRGIEDELTLKAMLNMAKLLSNTKSILSFELYVELNNRYKKINKDNTELLEEMYSIVIEDSKMLEKWTELMKECIENKHYKSTMKILKNCQKYKIKSNKNRKFILDLIHILENKLKMYFGTVNPIVLHFILDKADLLFSWDKKNVLPVYEVVHQTGVTLFGKTDEITVNALLGKAECLWHMGEINKCLDIYDTLLKDALDILGPFHTLRRIITQITSEHHVLTKHLLQAKVKYLREKKASLSEIEYIRMYARVMRPDTKKDEKIEEILKEILCRDFSFNTSMSLLVHIFNRIRELVFLS